MKKLISVFLSLLMIINITALFASAREQYIYVPEYAATEQTLSKLDFKAESIKKEFGVSVFFYMSDTVHEKGAYQGAYDFYKKNVQGKGIVFCMDPTDGKSYIYGGDDFSENECREMLVSYSAVEGGRYGDRIGGFLDKAKEIASRHSDSVSSQSERIKPRFMDMADIIDDNRESAIYTDIDNFSDKNLIDTVFVTYPGSEEPGAYAESYYEKNNFGFGKNKDGIILAICGQNGSIGIRVFGSVREKLGEKSEESLTKNLSRETDPIEIFIKYLEAVNEKYNSGEAEDTTEPQVTQSAEEVFVLPDRECVLGEKIERIYDGAGIISDKAQNEILRILDEVSTETGLDFCIMTVYEVPDEMTAKEYAEKYFSWFDFGTGGEKNGVLLMIAFEPDCCFLTAFGKAQFYFSQSDLKDFTESFWSLYKRESYDEAAKTFALEAAQRLMKEKLKLPVITGSVLLFAVIVMIIAIASSKKKKYTSYEETEKTVSMNE